MNRTLIIGTASGLGLALAFPIHLNGYRSKNPSFESLLSQMGDDQARS
jgi:hypothetical protein